MHVADGALPSGAVTLSTESGPTDLAWIAADALAVTTDRGQLQIVRVRGTGGGAHWGGGGGPTHPRLTSPTQHGRSTLGPPSSVRTAPDGDTALTLETSYTEHDDTAVAVAISSVDPARVATAAWDGMVNLWTLHPSGSGQQPSARQFKGHTKQVVNDVVFSSTDANVFASVASVRSATPRAPTTLCALGSHAVGVWHVVAWTTGSVVRRMSCC